MSGGQDWAHEIESTGHRPTESEREEIGVEACRNTLCRIKRNLETFRKYRAAQFVGSAIEAIGEET